MTLSHMFFKSVYLILGFGAEVLGLLPAACGQVEDGGGSHVSRLGIVGVVVGQGGTFAITVETQAGRWGLGERGLSCREENKLLFLEKLQQKNVLYNVKSMHDMAENSLTLEGFG